MVGHSPRIYLEESKTEFCMTTRNLKPAHMETPQQSEAICSSWQNSDLLAFYAGLQPFNNDKFNTALYLIGYFTVEGVINFNQLSKTDIETSYKLYSNNAHIKRSHPLTDLVIVVGNKRRSRLLSKAVLISQSRPDKSGKPTQAVSEEMERLLGISGFIQRSIPPRFITSPDKTENLKKLLGL